MPSESSGTYQTAEEYNAAKANRPQPRDYQLELGQALLDNSALRERLAEVERENQHLEKIVTARDEQLTAEFSVSSKFAAENLTLREANKRLRAETIEECAKIAAKQGWCGGGAIVCGVELAAKFRALADAHSGKGEPV